MPKVSEQYNFPLHNVDVRSQHYAIILYDSDTEMTIGEKTKLLHTLRVAKTERSIDKQTDDQLQK